MLCAAVTVNFLAAAGVHVAHAAARAGYCALHTGLAHHHALTC